MLFVLLAAFLTKRPPWVQASVVGLCTGLFVAASAKANERTPLISSVVLLVLVVGFVVGVLFYLGLQAERRHGWRTNTAPPGWVNAVYAAAWFLSLLAAVRALLGAGGFKLAALAIVPIILLMPPALVGIRTMLGRQPTTRASDSPTTSPD